MAWFRRSRLGGTAGGVSLDDVQLAQGRVAFLAVGELAGEGHAVQGTLADDQVPRLPRGLASAGGGDALLDDPAPIRRVLLEVLDDAVGHDGLDDALDVGIARAWPSSGPRTADR